MNPTGKMSNFLNEEYEAVLNFKSTKKKKLKRKLIFCLIKIVRFLGGDIGISGFPID